jgi:response regulator RpfG family c-di-GMP phosphodiesterase
MPAVNLVAPRAPGAFRLPPGGQALIDQVRFLGLIDPIELDELLAKREGMLGELTSEDRAGQALAQAGLLTSYQLERLLSCNTRGLVLGSYRILDEIGRGGMGTVYLSEHRLMRRRAAIKVLAAEDDCPPALKARFFGEMRVLAELDHPNIVRAYDAGEVPGGRGLPALLYLVTELVEGGDLERHVLKHGVLDIPQARAFGREAALGLQAAHDRHLVHRDVKPSNLLLTRDGGVKVVDFGLARQFVSRLTDQRSLLGSIDFMPPEQSHDPSAVSKAADLYGLGATLFWLLTGQGPYPHVAHAGQALRQLQHQPPRRLRLLRPDVPSDLDELVARMLDRDPSRRPASALAAANALRGGPARILAFSPSNARAGTPATPPCRALVADEPARASRIGRLLAEGVGCDVCVPVDAVAALDAVRRGSFDLAVVGPEMSAQGLGLQLREASSAPNLKVVALEADGASAGIPGGSEDWAFTATEAGLASQARALLQLKAAQDRAIQLLEQATQLSKQLEQAQRSRDADIRDAHDALLFGMAKMAESRDGETPGHLRRMQEYTRVLAQEATRSAPWAGLVDARFLEMLRRCVPLHDIGKIGLPEEVLLKPASLSPSERALVQEHPLIGDRILEALGREHGSSLEFLTPARVIVRSHHERWDGRGYPDRLKGDEVPPAARLVALADVYDALRRMRMYKPAIPHAQAVRHLLERSPGQFDPTLLMALERCHPEWERIYAAHED